VISRQRLFLVLPGLLLLAACSGKSVSTPSGEEMLPYVIKVAGDQQAVPAGQVLTSRFTVQLRKDAGQVSTWTGQLVTFKAPASGSGGEFIDEGLQNVQLSGDRKSAWVQSGADGVVASPRFQTNATSGTYDVTASAFPTYIASKPGQVTFTVTNN